MNTLEPIGTLSITESARKTMNESGDIVSISYFDFKGFGFDSQKGDRISFFAATSPDGEKNLLQENQGSEQNKPQATAEDNTDTEINQDQPID